MEFYFLGFIILIFLIGIYLKSTENISDPFFREDGKFELRVSRWFLFGLISPSLMIVFSIYQYLEKVKNGEGWVLIILAVGVLILAVLESLNKKIVYGDSFIEKTNIFNKKSKIELGLISNVKKTMGSLRIIGKNGDMIKVKRYLKGSQHFVQFLRKEGL